jgi:hypothetical protein
MERQHKQALINEMAGTPSSKGGVHTKTSIKDPTAHGATFFLTNTYKLRRDSNAALLMPLSPMAMTLNKNPSMSALSK